MKFSVSVAVNRTALNECYLSHLEMVMLAMLIGSAFVLLKHFRWDFRCFFEENSDSRISQSANAVSNIAAGSVM